MIDRIKKYLEYRRNRKIAKREIVAIAATTLPLVRNVSNTSANFVNFITKLADESKKLEGEQLIQMVLDEVSSMLDTENNRIIEILTYLVSLSPSDIQKILVHSVVETIHK